MKAFRISGRFRMARDWTLFSKEVAAKDEAAAREKVMSLLGSHHGLKRKYITIATVEALPKDEIADPAVRYALEAKA